MIKFVQLLPFMILTYMPIFAQESELTNEELLIESSDPFFISATYGVDGIRLHDYFKYCRLKSDTLQVGDDLAYSILNGHKLTFNTGGIFPAKTTKLDIEHLRFHSKGSGLGEEEWSIGRSTNGSDPPSSNFKIARFFVYTGGGATYNTALSIDSNLNVTLGNITATEKLDVDGNGRFRDVPYTIKVVDYVGMTSNGTLVRISPYIVLDKIEEQQTLIETQQKEIEVLKKMEIRLGDLEQKMHLLLKDN